MPSVLALQTPGLILILLLPIQAAVQLVQAEGFIGRVTSPPILVTAKSIFILKRRMSVA